MFPQVRGAKGFQNHPSALNAKYSMRKLVIAGTSGKIEQGNTENDDGELLSIAALTSALQELPSLQRLREREQI